MKKRRQAWLNSHFPNYKAIYPLIFRHSVHLTILILAFGVTFNNLNAQNKNTESYNKTLISSLIGANSSHEEIIESDTSSSDKLTSYIDSDAFIKNIPKIEMNKEFKMAASKDSDETPAESADNGIEITAITQEGSSLIKPIIILTPENAEVRQEIEYYTIQQGDNPMTIAQQFGVSVNTVLWENKLTDWSSRFLKPGQQIAILPVTGISHIVKSGDTLESIAKKYSANLEEIVEFNGLEDSSALQADQILIIPDGVKPYVAPPAPKPSSSSKIYALVPTSGEFSSYSQWLKTGGCHKFVYGQCTSWVAYKRESENGVCVPSWGHAKSWMSGAIRDGFATCAGKNCQPEVGAIIVIRESWYGHVGYVESVSDGKVTFSEMNYLGAWKTSKRTFPIGYWKIIGYIY